MRVAHISYVFGEYCVRLSGGLAQYVETLLLLPAAVAASYRSLVDPAVHLRQFDPGRLRQPRRQLAALATIAREIRCFRPDVVHLQHGQLWLNLALPLLRSYPLVVTAHDAQHHLGDRSSRMTPQWVMDLGYRSATQLVVHSRYVRDLLAARLGRSIADIQVVPHIALGDPTRAPEACAGEDATILFFGRLWPYKGLEVLVRAEPLIAARYPRFRIVIAGQGEDLQPYRRRMANPDRFTVLDRFIPPDEATRLFRQASVVVLPYLESSQSGVIPMAFSAARPVVASCVGGLSEMVEHGRTGLLVPPRDERALAEAVVSLLQDPALRRRLGESGRLMALGEWSPPEVAARTLAVYERALETFPGRRRSAAFGSGPGADHAAPSPRPDGRTVGG